MPPKLNLKGGISDFNKKQKNEVVDKTSAFFITLNTNQSYQSTDSNIENDTNIMYQLSEDLLQNIGDYIKLDNNHNFNDDVKNIDGEYIVELGTSKKMLHMHAYLKFTHNATDLKLDYAKIKQYFCENLGLPNLFFNCRVARGGEQSIINYLHKYNK